MLTFKWLLLLSFLFFDDWLSKNLKWPKRRQRNDEHISVIFSTFECHELMSNLFEWTQQRITPNSIPQRIFAYECNANTRLLSIARHTHIVSSHVCECVIYATSKSVCELPADRVVVIWCAGCRSWKFRKNLLKYYGCCVCTHCQQCLYMKPQYLPVDTNFQLEPRRENVWCTVPKCTANIHLV